LITLAESQNELLETVVEEMSWTNLIAHLALGRDTTEQLAQDNQCPTEIQTWYLPDIL
jgi:hypothetical protein